MTRGSDIDFRWTSDINLGDFAFALRAIAPADQDDVKVVAATLQFELVPELVGDSRPELEPEVPKPGQRPPALDDADNPEDELMPSVEHDLPLLPLASIQPSQRPRPWELDEDQQLPRFNEEIHLAGVAHHEPLLDRRWSRQILVHTLATLRTYGELDVDAAVELIAAGRPVDPLPLLVRQSLSHGAQLLVDVGAGMAPFARDAWEFVADVTRLVGRSLVDVRMFDAVLSGGSGAGPIWTWRSYEPPAPGMPVLVLTDLGLSAFEDTRTGGERESGWLEFSRRLALNGSPLVLFVPYSHDRWPASLAEAVVLVEWDRTTTVGTVLALRDKLHTTVREVR